MTKIIHTGTAHLIVIDYRGANEKVEQFIML
jgi:hypothetical protein